MKTKDYTHTIPEQQTGKEIEAIAYIECKDDNDALQFYKTAKEKLLNINNWHNVAGFVSAEFQLFDNKRNIVDRDAQKGDYLRVDIPGPGSKEGDGYDWVHVEELKEITDENVQSISIRVRPTVNPLGNQEHIAHFYDGGATSNFIITKEGLKITASIIDRNVKPNDDTKSLTDVLRHSIIGSIAINSFSKIQWQNLVEGLIK